MYRFKSDCAGTPPQDCSALRDMIDESVEITRRTFLQHIDRDELRELEASLGYMPHPSQGLTMAGDWHVSYHRSRWKRRRCYYFRWSAIEYYFTEES